jgi:hypothetical protein
MQLSEDVMRLKVNAFGELDQDGNRNIETFQHQAVICFLRPKAAIMIEGDLLDRVP